jgi:hypothetical protein
LLPQCRCCAVALSLTSLPQVADHVVLRQRSGIHGPMEPLEALVARSLEPPPQSNIPTVRVASEGNGSDFDGSGSAGGGGGDRHSDHDESFYSTRGPVTPRAAHPAASGMLPSSKMPAGGRARGGSTGSGASTSHSIPAAQHVLSPRHTIHHVELRRVDTYLARVDTCLHALTRVATRSALSRSATVRQFRGASVPCRCFCARET